MNYKVVRDANNSVVAFGPNDAGFDPQIPTGGTLKIESTQPVIPPTFEQRNADTLAQIHALDIKRIRPLAENDTAYLATLNKQITALRAKLK